MKPRAKNETDESYIRRLESANDGLRRNNGALTKWAKNINDAVTILATDGSLIFQLMAEKAGVRSHPSVTKAVEMFDSISHPQWMNETKRFPAGDWPTDWRLEEVQAWSGDADMELNSAIAETIEYLESCFFRSGVKAAEMEHIRNLQQRLSAPLEGIVDGFLEHAHGIRMRTPVDIPEDVTRDQLASLVNDLSWELLDLAQDMMTASEWLRRDLRAACYRRVCGDLYRLSSLHVKQHDPCFDVKVLGAEVPF